MPRWETTLLPWDLFCSPGRIAWEGDIKTDTQTFRLLDRIGPVCQFGDNLRGRRPQGFLAFGLAEDVVKGPPLENP